MTLGGNISLAQAIPIVRSYPQLFNHSDRYERLQLMALKFSLRFCPGRAALLVIGVMLVTLGFSIALGILSHRFEYGINFFASACGTMTVLQGCLSLMRQHECSLCGANGTLMMLH